MILPFAPSSLITVLFVAVLAMSLLAPLSAYAFEKATPADASNQPTTQTSSSDNAALQYWRAFAVLPPIDEGLRKVLENPASASLTESESIAPNLPALRLLYQGVVKPRCDWGIDYTVDGPATLMPHLSKARELGKIASLRARIDASKNLPDGWRANLYSTFRLARDVGNGPLICRLVQGSIESTAYDCAAPDLPTIDEPTLKRLAASIDQLPTRPLSACMIYEKDFFRGWIVPKLELLQAMAAKDPAKARSLQHELQQDLSGLGLKDDEQPTLDPSDTPAKISAFLEQIKTASAKWDQVGQAFDLPLDQSLVEIDKIEKEKDAWPPVVQMFMPSARAFRISIARGQTKTALFRAGLAVALEGQDSLKNYLDPSTGQPFTYKALGDHAFELDSTMNKGGVAIVMTFGRTKAP